MMTRLRVRLETLGAPDTPVDPSAIQKALDSLREKNFLWKSQRGQYWIEDDQVVTWLSAPSSASR
jgi:hypothetical protein